MKQNRGSEKLFFEEKRREIDNVCKKSRFLQVCTIYEHEAIDK